MQTETPPFCVEVSLAEDVLSLGEPIVLRYEFVGTQAEVVELYMGRHKKGWLTITLVDVEGRQALPIPDPRMKQGGIYSTGIGASATSHAVEYVVVTRLTHPTHPGDYRLSALARLPYANKSQSGAVWPHLWEKTYGTVLTREDTFALTITPLDPDRLRAVAKQFAATAAQDKDRVRGTIALQALFSMPEKYVFPIWQEVTRSENRNLLDLWEVISDELAHVQSIETVKILSEMVWNPPLAVQDGMNNVAMKFTNIYFTADSTLKQQIEDLYLAQGRKVPRMPISIID